MVNLFLYQDNEYAKFHKKILKNNEISVIGIRTPILKKIAKEIAKNDYLDYILDNKHEYYEDILLHGLVITYLKDYNLSIKLFDQYINYINNWACCDIVVCNYKLFSKHKEIGLVKIKEYLTSLKPFINRVGIVLLLSYYIDEKYIDIVLELSNSIKNDDYYVKMANAWLISKCLVKYYDKTYKFLLNCSLDDWTYNKAIQKAIESYQIKNKDELRKLKR